MEARLKTNPIECSKLNYSLDQIVQNFRQYEAQISLSKDGKELIIVNIKPNPNPKMRKIQKKDEDILPDEEELT